MVEYSMMTFMLLVGGLVAVGGPFFMKALIRGINNYFQSYFFAIAFPF